MPKSVSRTLKLNDWDKLDVAGCLLIAVMISRHNRRKLLKSIDFQSIISSSSSSASRLAARKPNPPLNPQAGDDCNLHPPNDNAAHSALCPVDSGNPVCEKPSTPPLEGPRVEFWQDITPPNFDDPNRHHRKKENQYRHWRDEVIPALIQPYLDILRQTDHMQLPLPEPPLFECQCLGGRRPLKVLGVSWTSE